MKSCLLLTSSRVLVAQRKDRSSHVTHLFRSYNHTERFANDSREYNPQTLGKSKTTIWEACRATSAAPYYFRSMFIHPDHFLDGGMGNNNPSNIAWNEAKWMSNRDNPHEGRVAMLVSLGLRRETGNKPVQQSEVPLLPVQDYSVRNATNH